MKNSKFLTSIAVLAGIALGFATFGASWVYQTAKRSEQTNQKMEDRLKSQDNRLDQHKGQIRDLQIRCDRLEDLLADERQKQFETKRNNASKVEE